MSKPLPPIDWATSPSPVDYALSLAVMEGRVTLVAHGRVPELIWLLEHPPCYTAGTSAKARDLVEPDRFPVHWTGRGGQLTYHGPGQRVAYVMLDVQRRFGGDVRAFVATLERCLIGTFARFRIQGETRPGRVGIWVPRPGSDPPAEDKIAAIGLRIRRGISFHGLSVNVDPRLEHYSAIVPCGIREHGNTSLAALGSRASMRDVDEALRSRFEHEFGPTRLAACPMRNFVPTSGE